MRMHRMLLLGLVALVSLSASRAARAAESTQRPDFSGHWVMDPASSTMPPRPGGPDREGPPPRGAPPSGGRAGAERPRSGARPEDAPRGGPRGTPREFTLEQYDEQILLSERGRPFRVLVLTRERAVKSLAPTGTAQSEARWEGGALVIDDQTRGGAARKQSWRLEDKAGTRLVITTRIAAEGERRAIDMKQVFLKRAPQE